MNFSEKKKLLQDALAELSGYRTMQCGQNHENVVEIRYVNREMHEKGHEDHPEWKIQIKGLCSKELRSSTLGCSHSMVLAGYNWQVRSLISSNIIDEGTIPLQEINEIMAEIYCMDHEKGHLEKKLAVLKKGLPVTQYAVDKLAASLGELRLNHVQLVNQLDSIHQQVLLTLTEIMKKYELHSVSRTS